MVGLAGLGDGLCPFRMVDGVGVILGLQADAAALAVGHATLAGMVGDVVAGIELDAGAIGEDAHTAAGNGVGQSGAGVGGDFPVVIVAALEIQRVVISIDVLADGLGLTEVHGGAFNVPQLAGGDAFCIVGSEVTAGESQQLVHGVELFVASQVEVAVVGQVEDGVFVGNGIVFNVQAAVIVQGVGNIDAGLAGETLIAVGADQTEGDGLVAVENHGPQPQMEVVGAAVEIICIFVGGERYGFVADPEGRALDAVGAAAHGGTEETVALGVAFCTVIAQNHVGGIAVFVGNDQGHKMCAIVGDLCHKSTTGYGIQMGLLTGRGHTERFLHR